jgi:hypothetical protein
MTETEWILIGACVVAIVVVLVLGRRLGFIKLTLFGNTGFSAGQSRNEASVGYSKARGSINATTRGSGSSRVDHSSADGDINASSGPG